jgi:hypothetical protein
VIGKVEWFTRSFSTLSLCGDARSLHESSHNGRMEIPSSIDGSMLATVPAYTKV